MSQSQNNIRIQSIVSKIQLTGFFFLMLGAFSPAYTQEQDTSRITTSAQHLIGASFATNISTIPGASFSITKEKLSYGYFFGSHFLFKPGVTLYQTQSDFNAFDRKFMFNLDLEVLYYWRKLHLDLGLHNGNYAEFTQQLDYVPSFIQYGSFGGGFTLPIFNQLTLDFSFRKSIALNRFLTHEGKNPFESFFGAQYIIKGTNDRFRKGNKTTVSISTIVNPKSHFIGYGFSGGAFNWPSDEGAPFTYMINSLHYRYVLKPRFSIGATLLFSTITSSQSTINGLPKKNYNTLNGMLGARYHLGVFFTGVNLSVGSFSAFRDNNYSDRAVRFYTIPELGFNLRITPGLLFEFQMLYGLSINRFFNAADVSAHYLMGTIGVSKKLNWRSSKTNTSH